VRGYRFSAGKNFRVFGRLVLHGPGEVVIGDNVVLYGRVTPWTHSPNARIQIGDNCVLDGVRFGCAQSITIGRNCILAESRIMDTDFHSTRADRRTNRQAPVRILPVVVEDNVWVSAEAGLLPGAWIGRNSVVGFGAVCVRRFPESVILFGNPASVVAPVEVVEGAASGKPDGLFSPFGETRPARS
jgi:acetyltransferase-like isoleucine patch superfamily enzyme